MTFSKLSEFGAIFQIKVISALLTKKEFLINVNDMINPDDFENKAHSWIVEQTLKYYSKYHTVPTMDTLHIETKKIANEVLKLSVVESLREAYRLSEEDSRYVQEEFSNFCKNQQLKKALLSSADLLNAGKYDDIRNIIGNALKAGQDKNIGLEYEKDVETRYRGDERKAIPFPWKAFNNVTQGGYGKGDLVLIFGNPKGGKSWSVIAMAAEAVRAGYTIVYYALELGESYVGKRFDAYFTGIPVDQLDDNKDKVEEIMSKLPGKLIIKEYPPKRASLDTIENHLGKLRDQDLIPDGIFIDYLDLLKNRNSRKEKKDDIDDVYTDAKGLAKELDIPIVSPSQANRSGAEKDILESSHIAGSFDKIMIGDIVISLARTKTDKLKGTGRWHFMGNRYGPDGITFFANINTSNGHMNIEEDPLDMDTYEENNSRNAEKEEKNFLQREFLKFNSKKN